MPDYIQDYYRLGSQCIALIMTTDRTILQAWRADSEAGAMVRADTLILDLQEQDARQITPEEFAQYCSGHNIQTVIPEKSILLSFRLAGLRGPAAAASYARPENFPDFCP